MLADFRLLNKRTIPDEVAIPDMKETIELSGSRVYSLLDFLKAFNQIENTPKPKRKTSSTYRTWKL